MEVFRWGKNHLITHCTLFMRAVSISGVTRGEPSRARPNPQLHCSKTLLLLYNYDPCKQVIRFLLKDTSFFLKTKTKQQKQSIL